jgi:hypothetical protein
MNRSITGAMMVASMGLACGSGAPAPSCDAIGGFVYVDVPDGPGSVSSIEASGACASDPSAACAPISAACDGSACECKFLFLVTESSFGSDRTCHLRATSPTGQVFARDVMITTQDGRCFQTDSPFVMIEFPDAGAPDGGAFDGPDDGPREAPEATP